MSFGTALDHFAESEELRSLVDTLPHICSNIIALEASQERVTGVAINLCMHTLGYMSQSFPAAILDKYQEQPHLLDPYLGESIPLPLNC